MSQKHPDDSSKDRSTAALTDPVKSASSVSELLHAGLDVPSPFMKDIFLCRQVIVGIRFQGGSDELVDDLLPGRKIVFIAEPGNKYDPHAVMAIDTKGRRIGYIPRHENGVIGALLRAGKYIYGIVPEEQPEVPKVNRHTPMSLWVDLYMREMTLPEDMTMIPRQGDQGSYAVIAAELLTQGTRFSDDPDNGRPAMLRTITAIKVINGEERDIFTGNAPQTSGKDTAETMEEQRQLLLRFHTFAGYLPLVGHGVEELLIPALAEAYGVLLGIPFSNRVIDTRLMARNHLPGRLTYDLYSLSEELDIRVHCDTEQESICRKTWKLYCRMERSEL